MLSLKMSNLVSLKLHVHVAELALSYCIVKICFSPFPLSQHITTKFRNWDACTESLDSRIPDQRVSCPDPVEISHEIQVEQLINEF